MSETTDPAAVMTVASDAACEPAPQWPQHECSVCHRVAEWGPSWSWFGSCKAMEDGKPIFKFCSAACREKGPAGPAIETFAGVGTIEATTTYRIYCGGCGTDDWLEASTRRGVEKEAAEAGWVKHPVGGWICPKCAAIVALEDDRTKAKGLPHAP